jgi:hypothetical protein
MGLLNFLNDSFDALRQPMARLEVVEQDERICVVRGDRRQVVLDLTRRIADVGSAGRLPFAQFDSVEVERIQNEDDGTFWRVSLVPKLRCRVEVGSSHVDVDASIAAATLARCIGCPVKAF